MSEVLFTAEELRLMQRRVFDLERMLANEQDIRRGVSLDLDELKEQHAVVRKALELATKGSRTIATPENYRVLDLTRALDFKNRAQGSRDYCIGYAEGAAERQDGDFVVCVGSVIVWPDDRWGAVVEV